MGNIYFNQNYFQICTSKYYEINFKHNIITVFLACHQNLALKGIHFSNSPMIKCLKM